MMPLALFAVGVALVLSSAHSADPAPRDDSRLFDALLFMLCLVGIVAASSKRSDDSDDC